MTPQPNPGTLTALEYHVLVSLGEGPLYGYAIKTRVELESRGVLVPRAGSLYRVLARLMTWGLVNESTQEPGDTAPHPGLERKYYSLTPAGTDAVRREAQRLRHAAALAEQRLGLVDRRD